VVLGVLSNFAETYHRGEATLEANVRTGPQIEVRDTEACGLLFKDYVRLIGMIADALRVIPALEGEC
jgi:hypothetical protein